MLAVELRIECSLNNDTSTAIVTQVKRSARLSPSYTVTIQAPIHHDSSRLETDGKIGLHRDASGWKKKEIPVSIRCLTVLLRCQHDSSTDLLRLMTAALRFTTVELRMLTMPPRFDTVLVRFKPVALR